MIAPSAVRQKLLRVDRREPAPPRELLRAGWVGGWHWTSDGERVASINLRAELDRLHLAYRMRIGRMGTTLPKPSASSASPATSAVRDPISSVPVW